MNSLILFFSIIQHYVCLVWFGVHLPDSVYYMFKACAIVN